MEKFNWGTLRYFMSTKLKSLTGKLYDISCPQSGKRYLQNSTIFHFHQVEKFNWRTQAIFHVHEVEKFSWGTLLYFMFTNSKSLTEEICDISCLRSGKFYQENSTISYVHVVAKFNWKTLQYFMSTK